jgi:hypothetical protein
VTRTPERIGKKALTIIRTIEREVSAIVKYEGRDRLELTKVEAMLMMKCGKLGTWTWK